MNGMKSLLIAGLFVFGSTASMAALMAPNTKTALDASWICTTNASSSSVDADKASDDKMAKSSGSAAETFAYAASNCRDCTKITCEAQNK